MVDRLEQRCHVGEGVRPVLRLFLQMLIQPLMPRLPGILPLDSQPRPKMLPHERMCIQLIWCVMARLGEQAEAAEMGEQFLPNHLRRRHRLPPHRPLPPCFKLFAVLLHQMIG